MGKPVYPFTIVGDEALRFEFESLGPRTIPKVILIKSTGLPAIYSLALLDQMPDGSLSDMTVSDNGDMETVLATVIQCLSVFLDRHPQSVVAFAGSTTARTRLYRIAIVRELQRASERFRIWGMNESAVESFQPDGLYEGFLIALKDTTITF
jgi:hypothetical protein